MIDVTQSENELIQIPYSKLLKLELPRFAQRLIGLVERHNPEDLKINVLFDLLVAENPNIRKLIDKYGSHPLTGELKNLRKMRTLRISGIRFRLKEVIREDKSGEDDDVKTVSSELNHFFNNLELSKNEEMFNQKITQFLDSVISNAEFSSALDTLEFSRRIQQLQIVHTSIQEVISSKLVSISGRPQETTTQLQSAVLAPVKNLIKQIEIAPLLNPELDYKLLYSELNQLLSEYKVMINKRLLFNKKKAEAKAKAKADNQSNQSAYTKLIADSAQKMLNIDAEGVNVNMNGQEVNQVKIEPVENEKTAAMSSKTKQLPLVHNENGALEK